jgi:ABC-type Co2+ transport system permease subunit
MNTIIMAIAATAVAGITWHWLRQFEPWVEWYLRAGLSAAVALVVAGVWRVLT